MPEAPGIVTFLFTDIEGSSQLWEKSPEQMRPALARHDALSRAAVEDNRGVLVKMTGDGMHAFFADPLDALRATVELQQSLADPQSTDGFKLRVRCGLHAGVDERRDDDFFGPEVNRAARLMGIAHGGQILVSQAVAALLRDRMPPGVTLRDLGSVRLRDLSVPERVYQLVHPRLRDSFPALRTLDATPNNLLPQLTSFIGREHELAAARGLLGKTRLLTLCGAGGIGKTRLSLQLAAAVLDEYPDGVWFIELAPIIDKHLVPQAVASVLGVKEHAGRPVLEAVESHVRERTLLLILDNCEHLVDACAGLAKRLLQAGASLRILASSREPLRVTAETTYPVPALAVPSVDAAMDPAQLAQFEAVRLFIDRVRTTQPSFEMTHDSAEAVCDICRRLDGIPLAIELAAARVRAMSVHALAARLGDRFHLLTRGDRTALPRQQTLRAAIDWSHDLLTEDERCAFRRLAVFAGTFTLDAAEAVVAGADMPAGSVPDLLAALVEKSLVNLDAKDQRYRLLESVRQYAGERLTQSGEEGDVRGRHLSHYLALAQRAHGELVGPRQGQWLDALDLDRENILTAHAWCDRSDSGAVQGLRLVSSTRRYWINRGLLELGQRVTVEALARPGARQRDIARCNALFDAGQLGSWMGRYVDAQRYLEESLAIARELGDRKSAAAALQPLALAALGQGDLAKAREHLEEGLALARELGNRREVAAALNALAQVHRLDRDVEMATRLYEQALHLARELGDRDIVAITLLNLAMVSIETGASGRVATMLLEVLAIAEEIGSKPASQSVLEVSAGLAAARGDWQCAARLYGAAEAQTRHTGLHRDPADEAFLAPLIASARAALGARDFAAREAAGQTLSYGDAMRDVRAWLVERAATSPASATSDRPIAAG